MSCTWTSITYLYISHNLYTEWKNNKIRDNRKAIWSRSVLSCWRLVADVIYYFTIDLGKTNWWGWMNFETNVLSWGFLKFSLISDWSVRDSKASKSSTLWVAHHHDRCIKWMYNLKESPKVSQFRVYIERTSISEIHLLKC